MFLAMFNVVSILNAQHLLESAFPTVYSNALTHAHAFTHMMKHTHKCNTVQTCMKLAQKRVSTFLTSSMSSWSGWGVLASA